jgi:hypothetical protein
LDVGKIAACLTGEAVEPFPCLVATDIGVCRVQTVIAGHAFVQNLRHLRRGHYELGLDAPPALRVAAAFTELATI